MTDGDPSPLIENFVTVQAVRLYKLNFNRSKQRLLYSSNWPMWICHTFRRDSCLIFDLYRRGCKKKKKNLCADLVKGVLQFRSDRFTAITVIFPWRIVSSVEFRVMADRSPPFRVDFEPSSPFTTRRQRDGYCRWLTDGNTIHYRIIVDRKDFLFEHGRKSSFSPSAFSSSSSSSTTKRVYNGEIGRFTFSLDRY